jgi:hypothetical protein
MSDAPKATLTFEEKITAAFMHYVRKVSQQDIAIMLGGVNGERVNEACLLVKSALMEDKGLRSMDAFKQGLVNANQGRDHG